MAPVPPEKRLRMKTPDPKRLKSPDARALKKAHQDVKAGKVKAKPGKKDETARKLSFSPTARVHTIEAENPAGKSKPGKARPSKLSAKMTESEADEILAKFRKDCNAWV